jgi:hypothetical protein
MSNITDQTLDLIKQAQGYGDNVELRKSITTANNLAAYDLQAPAKNLYPVQTPIRNTLPRTSGIGTATNWRTVRSIIGSGFDAMGWVPEGQRTARMSYVTQSLSARPLSHSPPGGRGMRGGGSQKRFPYLMMPGSKVGTSCWRHLLPVVFVIAM